MRSIPLTVAATLTLLTAACSSNPKPDSSFTPPSDSGVPVLMASGGVLWPFFTDAAQAELAAIQTRVAALPPPRCAAITPDCAGVLATGTGEVLWWLDAYQPDRALRFEGEFLGYASRSSIVLRHNGVVTSITSDGVPTIIPASITRLRFAASSWIALDDQGNAYSGDFASGVSLDPQHRVEGITAARELATAESAPRAIVDTDSGAVLVDLPTRTIVTRFDAQLLSTFFADSAYLRRESESFSVDLLTGATEPLGTDRANPPIGWRDATPADRPLFCWPMLRTSQPKNGVTSIGVLLPPRSPLLNRSH